MCEHEREVSRATAEALLNLSNKSSRLNQEMFQLRLELCLKDQLIGMMRRQKEEEEEIESASIPLYCKRSRLSLPASPKKEYFHS